MEIHCKKTNQLGRTSPVPPRKKYRTLKDSLCNEDGLLIEIDPIIGQRAYSSISKQVRAHWEVVELESAKKYPAPKRTSFDKLNNPPFSRTQNFTKRCVYELGRMVLKKCDADCSSKIAERLEKVTRRLFDNDPEAIKIYETSPSPIDNPFAWGYLMIFGVGKTWRTKHQNTSQPDVTSKAQLGGNKFILTRDARYKASLELLYAHRHDVPAEYLVGFISQCGGHERIIPRVNRGEMEDWYKRRQENLPY